MLLDVNQLFDALLLLSIQPTKPCTSQAAERMPSFPPAGSICDLHLSSQLDRELAGFSVGCLLLQSVVAAGVGDAAAIFIQAGPWCSYSSCSNKNLTLLHSKTPTVASSSPFTHP
ncbi:hypothetical protein LR48_Vigan11g118000 [Vigna angularis]|uniref:Uncharacterized protein n=2 Tax=Phaseolus angularis TaxID=3914 RepID=A0A0L9VSU1_PHAAN|nr:hypothetical protein LR48_Vigan11g118000 [Vigna angularis]BAT97359.1 hypothetical protein VIGAN_09077800 [Vigna angularis var. angularis]